MNEILFNEAKITLYAQIQRKLCELEANSTDEEIDQFINEIPSNFFNQKDDLMLICQLFGYYARIRKPSRKKNAVKLFERILIYIKIHLKDEQIFFWSIFGSNFYFKLWMYEEGLISIEQIILSAQEEQSSLVIEYFLPEILSEKPEVFEKELKFKYKKEFSEESLHQFKETRKKHFKWLRESADYNDPLYDEIEKNRLRLSIKRDDIDTFQKVLSELNLSVNSKIMESSIENFLRFPAELSLLEYAIEFNSIKIIKFLIMNNADFTSDMIYFAIQINNYDVIHILESKFKEKFGEESLQDSITVWNDEMTEYSLNNFSFNFFNEIDIDPKNELALKFSNQSFVSLNFMFLQSTVIPFLKNNPEFVKHNINELILGTFSEYSCFFLREFLKYPEIDVNHHFTNSNITFLFKAIEESNVKGVEILLNHPDIDVNCPAFERLSPIQVACKIFSDMRIIKLLCNHPKMNIDQKDATFSSNAFQLGVCCGHIYAAQYFVDNFPDLERKNNFYLLFFLCLRYNHLFSLKIILRFFLIRFEILDRERIIDIFRKFFRRQADYLPEFEDQMRQIMLELTIE